MNDDSAGQHPLESLHPRSLKHLSDTLQVLVRGRLWLQVMIAMILGLAVGVALGPTVGWVRPDTALLIGNWLALPGQLFLALIQMIVIPLVFASIIRGLASSESVDQLKKMGTVVILYFVVTTALAIVLGLWLTLLIEPGQFVDSKAIQATLGSVPKATDAAPALPGLHELPTTLITLLPANPLTSMVESNMLQVVVFAIVMGAALVIMAPVQSKPLLELLGSLQEVCMTVVRWAMMLAPLAVFGLLAQLTAKVGLEALLGMAAYVGTVLLGLFILFLVYLALVFFAARIGPAKFLRSTRDVLLLAFSTSSSAAVMPLSIKTAEEGLGVRPSVSQFVIPIGATLNMNGTALYQGVATIFLAQVFAVDIGISGMLLVVVTAVGASIGSPATPGVGIVILAMVLSTVGVPAAGIALIMGVDRILDMSRTAVNVSGDLVASVLMGRWIGDATPMEEERASEDRALRHQEATGETVLIES
ncbi:MAG: dicarboxylate/amino acid:cation symporter [Rhodospirillales bacterium]|nr:dicarboxylate/amino acid:cation symporter [Rhodospirillales bacterium]